MVKNANDEVVQWKVRWWSPSKGEHCGTEKGSFQPLLGASYLELINVDDETLVASTSRLVSNGKKLPASLVKEAVRVLQSAVVAEANGEVRCNACHEDKDGEEMVSCGCCSRSYHLACTSAAKDTTRDEWWCPACDNQP